ncbi:MAG: HAMP domain-containing sensor histidine kinase [Candidatus Nomurabacteria bacterium]|nr:HAMP domain-containing sensor histidine kinase [Candidatus Nomurabacteria bacterium]
MQKLYKQFAESVTKWKISHKADEFFIARLRLTFFYFITAVVILGGASFALYNTILSNFSQSISENIFLDPNVSQAIIDRAQDILLNRFLTIDAVIVFFIVVLGFFLTNKTLKPIKLNMQKQKRFIADASHELRTPIAVVISGLEVNLSNKKLDLTSAKKTLEDTLEEMKEFSKLANSLLDISKYDTPIQIAREPIVINELIKSIVEKEKSLAQVKQIKIEAKIESSAVVNVNKIELTRVFFNILDNAIKYTPQNGIVTVSDKIDSNKYTLSVSDNGPGIPKDILSKIFEPFFRGDLSRSTEGAGLGLTLSKKIIENHDGTIFIKSQVGKGTNVIICLPISS